MNARELNANVKAFNIETNALDLYVQYCDVSYLTGLKSSRNDVKFVGFVSVDQTGCIRAVICRDNGTRLPVLSVAVTVHGPLQDGSDPVGTALSAVAGIEVDRWVMSPAAFTQAEAMVHTMMERLAVIEFSRRGSRR